MSNPFSDLQGAFASASGFDVTLCGFILGLALMFVIILIFEFVMDPSGKDRSGFPLFAGVFIGMIVDTIVGWFPIWVILVAVIFLAFILLDPFGTSKRTA